MHTLKITPNLLFDYRCTSGKLIRLPNRIESKLFFARIGMLYNVRTVATAVCLRQSTASLDPSPPSTARFRRAGLGLSATRSVVVRERGGTLFRQIFWSRNGAPANIVDHTWNANTEAFRLITSYSLG